ncbi:MAG: hypothetical protein IMY70_06340 [Bacteroidetes bacterium]|nr:hypothetical protein [Bacteroidota bacterium]
MDNQYCPNYHICKLVNVPGFIGDGSQRKNYIAEYCQGNKAKWESCKRLIVKDTINFCPDFVLPDTSLSIDEIIDKFDEINMNV